MLYLILVLFVLIGGGLTVFVLQNFSVQTHLVFFSLHTPEMPIGLLLLFAFLVGAFLLYIIAALSAWQDRREIKRLSRRVAELERQPGVVLSQPIVPAAFQSTDQLTSMPRITFPKS